VSRATLSKSTLATRSGRLRRPTYSFAPEMRRRFGSFWFIDPELSMARMMSWSTFETRLSWIVGT